MGCPSVHRSRPSASQEEGHGLCPSGKSPPLLLLPLLQICRELFLLVATVSLPAFLLPLRGGQGRAMGDEGRKAQAVFFDLDDTLVLTHAADKKALAAVKLRLASRLPLLDHQAVIDGFVSHFISQPWDPSHQIDVTEWRSLLWNKGLLSQAVDDMQLARDIQSCFDSERLLAFQWAEGVELLIKSLHSEGVKMGIITNGHPKIQREKLKACKADELFDIILVGGEEPNEKPHKDIFLKACKLVGCTPENSIMVGDNLKTDIQGGLNAGFLSTVWVNTLGIEERSGPKPHHTVKTIMNLQTILKAYGLLS